MNRKSNYSNKAWAPKPERIVQKNGVYSQTSKKSQKSDGFFDKVEETYSTIYNLRRTENGALGYSTSGSKLLDLNFAVSSLRGASNKEIAAKFREAFNEDSIKAMRWLFYARDIREGLGERNIFRVCMNDIARNGGEDMVNALIPLCAEYGRWDDVIGLLDTKCKPSVIKAIIKQWRNDVDNFYAGKSISLMAKWLPSEQASNQKNREYASIIRQGLKLTPRQYRKTLSALRKQIDVVERKMSSNNWQAIDYEAVPSKANLNYNNAFLKHDTDRRRAYLSALTKGEAKINSSVAFPHDIVHKYLGTEYYWRPTVKGVDAALEGMWKALPDMVNNNESTIVVADGSGSMTTHVGNTNISALSVANALAIYFAERCSGEFKNKYITFSENPQLVKLSGKSLHDNLQIALKHNEVANTNIEAVFDLLLDTAVQHHMLQEEIPANILIISDMEFDGCVVSNHGYNGYSVNKTLFNKLAADWKRAGYKMPRLVFWNVNSRTKTIPIRNNEAGVALVSGFSPNVCKMVMSNKTDPYDALIEAISVKRYDAIEKAVRKATKEMIN